jgi:hypothetical protein
MVLATEVAEAGATRSFDASGAAAECRRSDAGLLAGGGFIQI